MIMIMIIVAILMMITESRTFTLDVGQSVRLDCEFYMDNFDMFDNPVIWKKRQHGAASSPINTMRNIHRPFVDTGRFDVSLMADAPRYRLQLGVASKSHSHATQRMRNGCFRSSAVCVRACVCAFVSALSPVRRPLCRTNCLEQRTSLSNRIESALLHDVSSVSVCLLIQSFV